MKRLLVLMCAIAWHQSIAQVCNNWLATLTEPSYVDIGHLDVAGTAITVEATINRTLSYAPGIGNGNEGDVVSKHDNPGDVNYLLRPNHAYVTTSNGFFATPDVCEIQLNKTYHIALVYDGSTLKYYRDGYLMSQVPATGTLFQNNWPTRIGRYSGPYLSTFLGYINEVRIWNVARTQTQLRTYMNSSLPSPASQTGLLAYYTFTDALNKQGNTAWNGTLGGGAILNSTNTSCNFTADSCLRPINISNIINEYTPIIALDPCLNKITVEDGSQYNTGDTVLLIQMKGAIIDSTNTAAFGNIINYRNAGNYEFNYVKSRAGNIIELKNRVTRQYDLPTGKVQLIRVPYYTSVNVSGTLTCLPWDGSKGGVLVLNTRDTVNLQANIDVTGKGFIGGPGFNSNTSVLTCFLNDYSYPITHLYSGMKGESIATISDNIIRGKGNLAAGGGGGLGHNSGGGGGGNGGIGGFGGYQLDNCGSAPFDNRGIGGISLLYSTAADRIFLGSGGGAGQADNVGNIPPAGGNGGGMAIIMANFLQSNGNSILANGLDGVTCSIPASTDCHDGMGGGGAGGTVLMAVNNYIDNAIANKNGGKGADVSSMAASAGQIGPGGGGAGGALFINKPALPATVTSSNTGGLNGGLALAGYTPWGSTPGSAGLNVFNLVIPIDAVAFKPNIDSVRFNALSTSCSAFNFNGLGYTNTNPVSTWQWYFGDGGTAATQNTTHNYSVAGTYPVKLIITDINGCRDSIIKNVNIAATINADFSYIQDVCNPLSVQFNGQGTSILNPYWSFGDGTIVTGNLNPVHIYSAPGVYIIKYSVFSGACVDTIIKTINVNIANADIILTHDTTICKGAVKQLLTVPSLAFCWTPTTFLDDPLSANPITSTTQDIVYYFNAQVTGTNLIINGNFNAGNTGFTSAYGYANPNITEGQYFVGPAPAAWNPGLSACSDHTGASGNGNMLLLNGSPVPDVKVWAETITITPNTNYAFSAWVQALYTPNPAQLRFSINGTDIGPAITASLPTCTWTRFYTTWNSGSSTTADISIVNKNILVQGNDFALDDISFAPVFIQRDSVRITVEDPLVRTIADATACQGIPVSLTTTGANTYNWSPPNGLSNAGIGSPVATPVTSTQYIVTGTTINGCVAKDTVNITVKPAPLIQSIRDTAFCGPHAVTLNTTGGQSYSWTPPAGLSNSNIGNPVFIGTIAQAYTYYVTGTGVNSCTAKDTVTITVNAVPQVSTINNIAICRGDQLQLLTSTDAQTNTWTPATAVSNPNIANPYFTDTATQILIVTGMNATSCFAKDTVTITVRPIPVIRSIADTSFCGPHALSLTTTGGQTYSWTPPGGLSDPAIASPVFNGTVPQTYTYYVTGTGANSCTAKDTVTITLNAVPVLITINNTSICRGDQLQLLTSSDAQGNSWTPATAVSNPNTANPYFTDTATQMLIVTGMNATGCFAKDTVTVTVKPIPVIRSIADTSFCGPNPVTLTTTGGQTYSWTPPAGLSDPAAASPVFNGTVAQTYTYYVTGTAPNACTAKDTVRISIYAVPVLTTINNISICRGDQLQLLTSSDAQSNQWLPAGSVNNPTISNPYFTDSLSQQMIITGTNLTGCFAKDTVMVTVKPRPIVRTIADTTTCTTNTITLFTTGAQTYSWSPASGLDDPAAANPVFTGTGINTYYVTGTATNGCIAKDTVTVTIGNKPVFAAPANKTICAEESVTLNGNNGPAYQYTWTPASYLSNTAIIDPVSTTPSTITYLLLIRDNVCKYDSSFAVLVTVNPLPSITATKSNDLDCSKPDAHLIATGAVQYSWSPATGLDNPGVYNPVASPAANVSYIVTGTDGKGCSGSTTIEVLVKGGKYFGFNIPNSFTPNGDGLNDCFGVGYWGQTGNFTLMIYNRWGEKVFETHSQADCWNGTYKGAPAEAGNYVYYLHGTTLCGDIRKKGNVLLIR